MIRPLMRLALACSTRDPSIIRVQRETTLGIMPMASITSALRAAACASSKAPELIWLARTSGPRVARSFASANIKSKIAPLRPIQPSKGWRRKTTPRNIGVQGASRIGNNPGPVKKLRTIPMSRTGWIDEVRWPNPAPRLAASTTPLIRRSSQVPSETITRPRTISRPQRMRKAKPATRVK